MRVDCAGDGTDDAGDGEGDGFDAGDINAGQSGGEFILANRDQRATEARVLHAIADEDRDQQEGEDQIIEVNVLGEFETENADVEEFLFDARKSFGAIGDWFEVDQDQTDDFTEAERDDREVVTAQSEQRRTEAKANEATDNDNDGKSEPEGDAGDACQSGGVSADGIKCDVTEIEQAGVTDGDI